jgi:hypothetical protein
MASVPDCDAVRVAAPYADDSQTQLSAVCTSTHENTDRSRPGDVLTSRDAKSECLITQCDGRYSKPPAGSTPFWRCERALLQQHRRTSDATVVQLKNGRVFHCCSRFAPQKGLSHRQSRTDSTWSGRATRNSAMRSGCRQCVERGSVPCRSDLFVLSDTLRRQSQFVSQRPNAVPSPRSII